MVCGLVWLQEWMPKKHAFERHGIACLDMITVLGSIVNIIRGGGNVNDHLVSMKISTLIVNEFSYNLQRFWAKWLRPWFGNANHLVLIVCFISSKKRASRKNNHLKPIYLSVILVGLVRHYISWKCHSQCSQVHKFWRLWVNLSSCNLRLQSHAGVDHPNHSWHHCQRLRM